MKSIWASACVVVFFLVTSLGCEVGKGEAPATRDVSGDFVVRAASASGAPTPAPIDTLAPAAAPDTNYDDPWDQIVDLPLRY